MLQRLHSSEYARGEDVREQEQRAVRDLREVRGAGGRLQRAEVEERPPGLRYTDVLRLAAWEMRNAEEAGVNTPTGEPYATEAAEDG